MILNQDQMLMKSLGIKEIGFKELAIKSIRPILETGKKKVLLPTDIELNNALMRMHEIFRQNPNGKIRVNASGDILSMKTYSGVDTAQTEDIIEKAFYLLNPENTALEQIVGRPVFMLGRSAESKNIMRNDKSSLQPYNKEFLNELGGSKFDSCA